MDQRRARAAPLVADVLDSTRSRSGIVWTARGWERSAPNPQSEVSWNSISPVRRQLEHQPQGSWPSQMRLTISSIRLLTATRQLAAPFLDEFKGGNRATSACDLSSSHDDQAAGAHDDQSGQRERSPSGDVKVLLGDMAREGGHQSAAALNSLPPGMPPPMCVDQVAQGGERHLDQAGVLDRPARAKTLRPLVLGCPCLAFCARAASRRMAGEIHIVLDVVQQRGLADLGGEGRRSAAIALNRSQEGRLFTADQTPRSPSASSKSKPLPQNIFAQPHTPGLLQGQPSTAMSAPT